MLESKARKLSHHVFDAARHALAPAVHLHLSIARGHIGNQQASERTGCHLSKPRLAHQNRTERDALATERRELIDARKRANATTDIHREALDRADRLDSTGIGLARLFVLLERSGKIDDVHPCCALLRKRARHGSGIVAVHLHMLPVAALKAHHLAGDKVDSRKENHVHLRR